MPELHPTIVEQNGAPVFVVLPYAEFMALKAAASLSGDAEWDVLLTDARSEAALDQMYADAVASGPAQDMAEGFHARIHHRS